MGKLLSINGVTFQGRTDILSWNFDSIEGGLEVNWGELGTDIIEGSDYSRSSTIAWKTVKVFAKPAPQDYGTAQGAYEFYPVAGKDLWGCWEYGGGNFYPFLSVSTQPIGVAYYMSGGQGWVAMYYLNGQGQSGASFDTVGVSIRERGTEITITSNTGAKSSRLTQIEPLISILSPKCRLTVTYSDGKTSIIGDYPQCPTVERIEDSICIENCNIAKQIITKLGG